MSPLAAVDCSSLIALPPVEPPLSGPNLANRRGRSFRKAAVFENPVARIAVRAAHPMSRSRPTRPALIAALLLALALPAAAEAAPAVLDVPGSGAAIRDYWTKERMREAEPPAPLAAPAPPAPSGGAERAAVPTYVSGAGPGEPPRARLRSGARVTDRSVGRDAVAVTDPAASGNRAHGKVFFTIRKGSAPGDYVCSGTAVNSRNRSLVWTAGHCVYDYRDGGRVVNFAFVPAYDRGATPYGIWPARKLATTKRWRRDGNLRFDLGAATVRRLDGSALQSVVGARGIGFDQPRRQDYSIFGYPAMGPFDGESEYRCDSRYLGGDLPGGPGPKTMRTGCDMTRGASGGGWIAAGTLLSVTSYGYTSHPGKLYGPYLSRTAKKLYKRMRGRAGRP
jgi:V8-like Glu-specific endopeptidase